MMIAQIIAEPNGRITQKQRIAKPIKTADLIHLAAPCWCLAVILKIGKRYRKPSRGRGR